MKPSPHCERPLRWAPFWLATVLVIQGACGGVKDQTGDPAPVVDNGSGGTAGKTGAAQPTGVAGASGAAGPTGAGGTTAGATGGTTGTMGTGGTTAAGGTTGRGGTTGSGGSTGTGGTAGTGGAAGTPDAAGPVGPSGVFINIAGTMVPKEKAIVFIHFGHSNMVGHGTGTTELTDYFFKPQARLWSYDGTTFTPAKERTAVQLASTDQMGGGPGMALLKAAAALAGPDYHFISVAKALGVFDTTTWQKGGPLYTELLARTRGLKGKVTFGGAFVMLGVTDRHLKESDWPKFPERFTAIIKDLRADMGEPTLPILECDYEVGATASDIVIGSPFAKIMRPLLTSLPTKITNLALVPADGVGMQDDHHFSLAGHKVWADRAVNIMKEKGWFPWAK